MSASASTAKRSLGQLLATSRVRWGEIRRMLPLAGGSISRTYRAETDGGPVLFKWDPEPPPRFFHSEAMGLVALREAAALHVPEVYGYDEHGIAMAWLEVDDQGDGVEAGRKLGTGLAEQHRLTQNAFGFSDDNYIGKLPQLNSPLEQWTAFYRERRLRVQLEIARSRGRLHPQRERQAERLLERLPEWIDDNQVKPALLHGDLWSGNWLPTSSGPALIDPAVSYGDREIDLSMAALFGGFPPAFFEAYHEAFPLLPGHEARRPLYQLYYLLVHLNTFGESYGPQVDRILRQYGA